MRPSRYFHRSRHFRHHSTTQSTPPPPTVAVTRHSRVVLPRFFSRPTARCDTDFQTMLKLRCRSMRSIEKVRAVDVKKAVNRTEIHENRRRSVRSKISLSTRDLVHSPRSASSNLQLAADPKHSLSYSLSTHPTMVGRRRCNGQGHSQCLGYWWHGSLHNTEAIECSGACIPGGSELPLPPPPWLGPAALRRCLRRTTLCHLPPLPPSPSFVTLTSSELTIIRVQRYYHLQFRLKFPPRVAMIILRRSSAVDSPSIQHATISKCVVDG